MNQKFIYHKRSNNNPNAQKQPISQDQLQLLINVLNKQRLNQHQMFKYLMLIQRLLPQQQVQQVINELYNHNK